MRHLALLILSVLLAACRDVPRPDYVIELTTDAERHQVELWTRPDDSSLRYFYAFTLELPRAAYAFRQNHTNRRQAVIGLLLDRATMLPLTPIIASNMGPPEHRALIKALRENYRDRELFVTIRGAPGHRPLGRPSADDPMLRPLGVKDGFQLYENPAAVTFSTTADRPALWGWSTSDPVIRLDCGPRSAMCGLFTSYRQSELHFTVARNELGQAQQLRERIVSFLDRSFVSSGRP